MKWVKVIMLSIMLLFLIAVSSFALAESNRESEGTFIMPSSLRIIEESAFEDTRAEVVILPNLTTQIHDRAFADNSRLRMIFIPSTTTFIGEEAFAGSEGVTIFGIHGSYAQKWAEKYGLRFVHLDIWHVASQGEAVNRRDDGGMAETIEENPGLRPDTDPNDRQDLHPREKPGMYPIDYDFP